VSNILIHKANELKPETRAALEAEFGRSLRDDEEVSIMAFIPHEAPTDEARSQAAENLRAHFEKVDARRIPGSDEEIEEEIKEAMRSVRPGYREIE